MAAEIKCPNCGYGFDPGESFKKEVQEQLRAQMEDWKKNLLACFKSDMRTMPRADGFGVVPVGGTSDLTKEQASDFMEFIAEYGARHGVIFHDERRVA